LAFSEIYTAEQLLPPGNFQMAASAVRANKLYIHHILTVQIYGRSGPKKY